MDLDGFIIRATILLVLVLVGWFWKQRRDRIALEIDNEMRSKGLIKMGLLSQLWHRMYLKHESPIIHGFEHIPNINFEDLYHFWTRMAEDFLTFRSVPFKPIHSDEWYWKELPLSEIDFKGHHIKQITISSKDFNNNINNESNMEKAVAKFVNSLDMSSMWDPKKPHWNVYYINFKEEHLKDQAYGYAKIHHAMGDGVLLSKLLEYHHETLFKEANIGKESMLNESESNNLLNVTKLGQEPKESISSMKQFKSEIKPKTPKSRQFSIIKFISLIPWTIYDFLISFMIFGEAPMSTPISTGYCQHIYKKDNNLGFAFHCNMAVSEPLLLKEVKILSHYYNGTINDFMVALFCHGVNKYMKEVMYIEDSKNNKNDEPIYWSILKKLYGNDFYIRFVSVFNIRSLLSSNMDKLVNDFKQGNFDNEFVLIPLNLPIGDMVFSQRIKTVKNNFDKMKYGPMPSVSAALIKVLYYVGGSNLVVWLIELLSQRCNIMLSNLAGPKAELPVFTNTNERDNSKIYKITNVFNVTNPSNMSISCGVMSYVDKITIAVSSDINTMKTPDLLVKCINDEFETLKKQYYSQNQY